MNQKYQILNRNTNIPPTLRLRGNGRSRWHQVGEEEREKREEHMYTSSPPSRRTPHFFLFLSFLNLHTITSRPYNRPIKPTYIVSPQNVQYQSLNPSILDNKKPVHSGIVASKTASGNGGLMKDSLIRAFARSGAAGAGGPPFTVSLIVLHRVMHSKADAKRIYSGVRN